MKNLSPIARLENIVVQEINDEILVCDTTNNRVFCLNRTAGEVWKACDGKANTQQIAKDLSRKLGKNVSEEMVFFALTELFKENLLASEIKTNDFFNGISRREVIKRVGLSSMVALPLISSITMPTSAQAQSAGSLANGTACSTNGQCASGNCVDGFCCNAPCTALCQACSAAKKGSGANGACGNISAGLDPDNECGGSDVCNGSGACRSINGTPCSLGSNCLSGNCVDGFCCNTACGGICQACSAAKTGGSNGTCGFVPDGADPDNECAGTSVCNGAGGCRP